MKNFDQFKTDFKRDVLVQVIIDMKYGVTSKKRAAVLAEKILEIFKEEKASVAFAAINKLAETQPNILDIFIKRAQEFENRDKKLRLDQIHIYLKPLGGESN